MLPLRSLSAFLREGTLFYKPTTLAQFRFDLRLPPKTRAALNQSRLNIPGIRSRTAGMTYDLVADLDGIESAGERGRLLLRPAAIQTCYGWWVPEAYRKGVEEEIRAASEKRASKIENLTRSLKTGIESGKVKKDARARFLKLHRYLERNGLSAGESFTERSKCLE
ncbi:MAG: hypothetical protein ACJ8AT_27220 [Hyalangium sp.]|uniref:hypothetical protein n=1 Tax=Hyalangium sp. TaxID=2028555 RepID=UPI00389ABD85